MGVGKVEVRDEGWWSARPSELCRGQESGAEDKPAVEKLRQQEPGGRCVEAEAPAAGRQAADLLGVCDDESSTERSMNCYGAGIFTRPT